MTNSTQQELNKITRSKWEDLEAIAKEERYFLTADEEDNTAYVLDSIEVLQEYAEANPDKFFVWVAYQISIEEADQHGTLVSHFPYGERSLWKMPLSAEVTEFVIANYTDELVEWLKEKEYIQPAEMRHYLGDALDVYFVVSRNGTLRDVRFTVGIGGPNIFVTTEDGGMVEGYWGCGKSTVPLSTTARHAIFDFGETLFNNIKHTWQD